MSERHLAHAPSRPEAWDLAEEYAQALRALGLLDGHAVGVKPSCGGFAVVLRPKVRKDAQ